MANNLINLKKLGSDITRINKSLLTKEEIATYRTLNYAGNKSRTMLAREASGDTGIPVGTAKRRIVHKKATRKNPNTFLNISAKRVVYPGVRQLKSRKKLAGVSFIGSGKQRKRVTTEVKTKGGLGTVPFKIKGRNSGKILPVYVLPNYRKNKTSQTRKVQAMYYSSLAHVARADWQEKVNDYSIQEFRKEYPKQLRKAKYRGR